MSYTDADGFALTSPPDVNSKVFLQEMHEDMVLSQPKRPLQYVTVKMPLLAYLRTKRAAQSWNLTYTDVINFPTQRVVPILESPSGTVAEMLEQPHADARSRCPAPLIA
jgi:hypothetical protein